MNNKHYIFCSFLILGAMIVGYFACSSYFSNSYIIGDGFGLDYVNSLESYNYKTTAFVMYENSDTDEYELTYTSDAVDDFNGVTNDYTMYINDNKVIGTWGNGYFYGTHTLIFYDIDGEVVKEIDYTISIKFYSAKTILTISSSSELEADYLSDYYYNRGFELKIIKGV